MHPRLISRRTLLCAAAAAVVARGARAGEASPWQIGCYTRPWDQYEYRVALDGIAEAGYKHAGIMTAKGKSWVMVTPKSTEQEVREIGKEIERRGLSTISLYADFSPAQPPEQCIADLRRLIDHAVACGSPRLMLGGTGDEKLVDTYYRTIADCCAYTDDRKIDLSVKPHGGLNATGPQCRKIIQRINHPRFRLWYDPGNIFYYSDGKLDPVDDAATVDGLVAGMSVKDFKPPKEVLLTPGTGLVRFDKVLARLRDGGFRSGPLVVETLGRGEPAQITAEAAKTRKFLEQLCASLAVKAGG